MTKETKQEQVIEVEYNKDMITKDLVQDTFNEDSIEELLGEGAVIDDEIN